MKKLEPHESLKHVPMMPSHEIDALALDIDKHNQLIPIVLLNGKIIDGRNRYEACRRLKIEPSIIEIADVNPMWCEVNLNGVLADLSAAINRFGSAVPAYVCPYCKGIKVDGCKACKGRGVMSKFMYTHAVPEEMKR